MAIVNTKIFNMSIKNKELLRNKGIAGNIIDRN